MAIPPFALEHVFAGHTGKHVHQIIIAGTSLSFIDVHLIHIIGHGDGATAFNHVGVAKQQLTHVLFEG